MRIKTIVQGGDPAAFDRNVNACLAEGWELVEWGPRQVGPVNWSMYASLIYQEGKKEKTAEPTDRVIIDPIRMLEKISSICARHGTDRSADRCGWCVGDEENTCPLWGWCKTRGVNEANPDQWTFPEEYDL